MSGEDRRQHTLGFTLIELLIVVAIIAVLVGILLPALGKSRKLARTALCESNLRQFYIAEGSYDQDNKGRIGVLNWVPGQGNTQFRDLTSSRSDDWTTNQGKQACDIVRRRRGQPTFPLETGRSFNRDFWHLVLLDGGYLGDPSRLILPIAGCPEDTQVKLWQANEFNASVLRVGADAGTTAYYLYRPYWCTYQIAAVAWAPDRDGNRGDDNHTLYQNTDDQDLYVVPQSALDVPMGQRRYDEVSFPCQKVFFFDEWARHDRGVALWYAYPITRQPLGFFDGSVRYLKTGDADPGWNPETPNSPEPTVYSYNPAVGQVAYNTPTLSGNPIDQVTGYFRWTREGLHGADYR